MKRLRRLIKGVGLTEPKPPEKRRSFGIGSVEQNSTAPIYPSVPNIDPSSGEVSNNIPPSEDISNDELEVRVSLLKAPKAPTAAPTQAIPQKKLSSLESLQQQRAEIIQAAKELQHKSLHSTTTPDEKIILNAQLSTKISTLKLLDKKIESMEKASSLGDAPKPPPRTMALAQSSAFEKRINDCLATFGNSPNNQLKILKMARTAMTNPQDLSANQRKFIHDIKGSKKPVDIKLYANFKHLCANLSLGLVKGTHRERQAAISSVSKIEGNLEANAIIADMRGPKYNST